VLLDIWAPWCGPCKSLSPVLEKLEREYAGRFTLAKLNSDEQPEIAGQLSQAFGVRSIPFCVLFDQGQPVDGFVGACPSPGARLPRQARAQHRGARAPTTRQAEALSPGRYGEPSKLGGTCHQRATTRSLRLCAPTGAGSSGGAARLPCGISAGRAPGRRRALARCDRARNARGRALDKALAANKRDPARARTAPGAAALPEAMDELLEIVMRDKAWNDELARKTYVAILELLSKPAPKSAAGEPAKGALEVAGRTTHAPADPLFDQYRRKLSMALF
jgi:putative thioredoxin